jgi:hypothetical protein
MLRRPTSSAARDERDDEREGGNQRAQLLGLEPPLT